MLLRSSTQRCCSSSQSPPFRGLHHRYMPAVTVSLGRSHDAPNSITCIRKLAKSTGRPSVSSQAASTHLPYPLDTHSSPANPSLTSPNNAISNRRTCRPAAWDKSVESASCTGKASPARKRPHQHCLQWGVPAPAAELCPLCR